MRFLVDENLPVAIADLLRRDGHDVVFLPETDLRSASDEAISQVSIRERRVIVTQDHDFPLPDSQELHGLVLMRPPRASGHEVLVRMFEGLMADSAFSQVEHRITVISRTRP
jgi:hypothetical protein